mmetsp:Transcript_4622/g.14651  ORF Transcript_4622/g.14651 Transcript_4622/m.14651 type:complete len:279 (+) Transcript_4622:1611-2447(+)
MMTNCAKWTNSRRSTKPFRSDLNILENCMYWSGVTVNAPRLDRARSTTKGRSSSSVRPDLASSESKRTKHAFSKLMDLKALSKSSGSTSSRSFMACRPWASEAKRTSIRRKSASCASAVEKMNWHKSKNSSTCTAPPCENSFASTAQRRGVTATEPRMPANAETTGATSSGDRVPDPSGSWSIKRSSHSSANSSLVSHATTSKDSSLKSIKGSTLPAATSARTESTRSRSRCRKGVRLGAARSDKYLREHMICVKRTNSSRSTVPFPFASTSFVSSPQ